MKPISVLLCMLLSVVAMAQTKIIAHRSHSGQLNTLQKNTSDNFGLNPDHFKLKVDSVERISPTMILLYKQAYRDEGVLRDSVFLHTAPTNIVAVLDSLKKVYPGAKFKGFDTSVRAKKKDKSGTFFLPSDHHLPSTPFLLALLVMGTVASAWYLQRVYLTDLKYHAA